MHDQSMKEEGEGRDKTAELEPYYKIKEAQKVSYKHKNNNILLDIEINLSGPRKKQQVHEATPC